MQPCLGFALGLVLAASPATPGAPADPTRQAERWLAGFCRTSAADPKAPWGLAHGVGAFGPSHRAADGRLAIDAMVEDSLRQRDGTDPRRFYFPEQVAGTPVEPHPGHTVATLLHAGVPGDRIFRTRVGEVSLEQLARSLEQDFAFEPSDAFFRHLPWTLEVLAARHRGDAPRFAGRGGEVDLEQVVLAVLSHLGEQTRFLSEARRQGLGLVQKRRQGLWSHPCGGLHLVEAALGWAGPPGFRASQEALIEEQVDLLFYRIRIETRIYRDALRQAPEHALRLQVQRLKFFGHVLETLARLRSLGLWQPTPARRRDLALARAELTDAVAALRAERLEDRMAELKAALPQLHLDLVGDGCHAYSGLRRTR